MLLAPFVFNPYNDYAYLSHWGGLPTWESRTVKEYEKQFFNGQTLYILNYSLFPHLFYASRTSCWLAVLSFISSPSQAPSPIGIYDLYVIIAAGSNIKFSQVPGVKGCAVSTLAN